MTEVVLTHMTASITELKTNPMQTVASAGGEAIAILNRNKPAFYCVPADTYEQLMDMLEDMELAEIVKSREGEEEISVEWDDL
jgi:antitoxin StbD